MLWVESDLTQTDSQLPQLPPPPRLSSGCCPLGLYWMREEREDKCLTSYGQLHPLCLLYPSFTKKQQNRQFVAVTESRRLVEDNVVFSFELLSCGLIDRQVFIFWGNEDLLLFSCKHVLLEDFSSSCCALSIKVYSHVWSLQRFLLFTLPLCVFGVWYSDTGQLCSTCLWL